VLLLSKKDLIDMLKRIAEGIATLFGNNCEVVIHDLDYPEKSIIAIYNGHVTGRRVGDPLSILGIKNVMRGQTKKDLINYSAKTSDGRLIKCATFHIHEKNCRLALGINFDCTSLQLAQASIDSIINVTSSNHNDLFSSKEFNLGSMLEEAVMSVGKTPKMMKKKDRIQAARILEEKGAFLIHGSMQVIADYFNISRFTLYNYLKEIRETKDNNS
jgi:predicted transcriptional regulator YheO